MLIIEWDSKESERKRFDNRLRASEFFPTIVKNALRFVHKKRLATWMTNDQRRLLNLQLSAHESCNCGFFLFCYWHRATPKNKPRLTFLGKSFELSSHGSLSSHAKQSNFEANFDLRKYGKRRQAINAVRSLSAVNCRVISITTSLIDPALFRVRFLISLRV